MGNLPTCVDPALEILVNLEDEHYHRLKKLVDEHPHLDHEMRMVGLEFRFFKMFFWGLGHWQASQEYDSRFRSLSSACGPQLKQMAEELTEYNLSSDCTNLELTIHSFQKKIIPFKQQAKEICILLLGSEIRCKPCQQDEELFLEYGEETASFIELVLKNLEALNSEFHHLIAPVKNQIDFITGKLKAFGDFADPVSHSITRVNNLGELLSQPQTWANHLSCLTYLYWIDHGMDETLASTMGTMLSDLMHKITSCTSGVVASYFEGTLMLQLLASSIDFLLEELVVHPMKDGIETLREGFIFLLSFMKDPPEEYSEDKKLILGQIYAIINEFPSLICSIHSSEIKGRISETKISDFLQKIVGVEVEVRKLYAFTLRSALFNFPRTNALGFLDSLLQKLKKCLEEEVNFVARVRHGIQVVWEKLALLRPFMQHMTEIQNEQEELKDLWNRIVDVVYYASYITNLCPATTFSPWYGIVYLPNVIEEIKLIMNEVMEIKDPQMFTNKVLTVEMKSRHTLIPRATTPQVEGAFIGFKEDTSSIIDHLIGGRKDLTIISISGMPGQGKTTLAKRIYNDPKIQYHFHKTMWCYVSKECKIRDLMIQIVRDVSKTDIEGISKVEIQDLAERLRKCLKGRRYLVVMDDIWDDEVWCQMQSSFPDDGLGSRILFTSRNRNLKSQAEWNFISYPLRLFSQEESLNLMKEKLFHYNSLGPEFLAVGEQIAMSCNGLPLAVALAASLLVKTEQKLELWNQVAETLKSHLASEGCMHIIELSFKYLPEHLKSCFLYFGAFPRGKNIRAERLKLLWIAEGFIKENETRCSKDLAEECLDYLVSRSLVVVAERSSMGGIKRCSVHDLLYDLCLGKIVEDNFLRWMDRYQCCSTPHKYGHHRLCIGGSDPFIEARPTCRRMELPTCPAQSLLCFDRYFNGVLISVLKSFKVLTVLDLEDVIMQGDVFPEVILCNVYLKYLALQEGFKDIPPSIANLWNLETLILRGGRYGRIMERRIPDTIWRMKNLNHFRIDGGCLNLGDFEGNEAYMVAQHNMETLCGLILRDDPRKIVELLGRMARLRKLKCIVEGYGLLFSIFGSLKNLVELKIKSNFDLIRLELETYNSFPQNKNLRKLSLEDLELASWSAMSTIGSNSLILRFSN